jgi:GNAT superfamily N-acetyltransferase
MKWSTEGVLGVSADWVSIWYPPNSVHVDLGWLEFYIIDGHATVMRATGANMTGAELVSRVLEALGAHGAREMSWTIGPIYEPSDAEHELLASGAQVDHAIDICGYLLDRPTPRFDIPEAITVVRVRTRQETEDFEVASARAWGYPQPTEEDIAKSFKELGPSHFVGYWEGEPVGAGGYTLVADVARFWGTAVAPEYRRRGVYRALVQARMADAMAQGATLALVHAEPTSSPILQLLGFTAFGELHMLRRKI